MAPQLAYIGLGNMGRVRTFQPRSLHVDTTDQSPGHGQEHCRKGQTRQAADHPQPHAVRGRGAGPEARRGGQGRRRQVR